MRRKVYYSFKLNFVIFFSLSLRIKEYEGNFKKICIYFPREPNKAKEGGFSAHPNEA